MLTFVDKFKGFIYDFYIYSKAVSTGNEGKYANSGCDSACADYEFLEYEAGQACDGSCSQTGCVRNETCGATTCETNFDYCDLCYDRECKQCNSYAANGCEASLCAVSGNA